MFYEGFSTNMKRELITSDIGILLFCQLLRTVNAKIEELADAQLDHEKLVDQTARSQRRVQLVAQLHDVVSDMTDRMIARLNSNAFIRVPVSTVWV